MNSFQNEEYTWAWLSKIMVKGKLEHKNSKATSIVSCNGTRPYTSHSHHIPYKEMWHQIIYPHLHNYFTRKLFDAFSSLTNGFKLREM